MSERVAQPDFQPEIRRAGYGLPCAKCNTYYFADLKECPVCHTRERIAQLTIVPVKVNLVAAPKTEASRPTEPKLIEINSERRSSPSLNATSKVATISVEPAEITTPTATAQPEAAVNVQLEAQLLKNAEPKIAAITITEVPEQRLEEIEIEAQAPVQETERAPFLETGSLVDCWAIIMGRDRTQTPTIKPVPPKEIAADDFSARCVKMLEEIYVSGETVVITSMGRPVARVVPIGDDTLKPTGT